MQSGEFAPGFRFSILDAAILAFGGIAAIGCSTLDGWWGFVIAFVLGHFFLFCNIVRMARRLELIWAAAFLLLAAPTALADKPGWPLTAALSLVVTLLVVTVEMRKPSYHGVGWQRINPDLPAWWEFRARQHRDA
jgi:hypothetical protein